MPDVIMVNFTVFTQDTEIEAFRQWETTFDGQAMQVKGRFVWKHGNAHFTGNLIGMDLPLDKVKAFLDAFEYADGIDIVPVGGAKDWRMPTQGSLLAALDDMLKGFAIMALTWGVMGTVELTPEDPQADKSFIALMDMSLRDFFAGVDGSIRILNALANDDIRYVGQLVALTEDQLLRITDFGITSLQRTQEALKNRQLVLGDKRHLEQDWRPPNAR